MEKIGAKESRKKKKKKMTASDVVLIVIFVVAITVAAVSGYKLYSIMMEYKAGVDEYNEIADTVVKERDADAEEVKKLKDAKGHETKHWTSPLEINFDELKSINQDVAGWLYMEALPNINYPIVQGSDNDFYLHHTYKKESIFAGSIFVDCKNTKDFSDQNTIVYGHNMKNGSMFGTLKQYKLQETIDKSPYFWVITPKEAYKYKMRGKGTHNQKAGTWSDDTSLTIALIKALGDKEFNVDSIARRMMDWLYKGKYTANGKVFDVGNTTREAIWRMHKGVSPIEAGGKDEYSNGNGSLMRIHPLAFYLLNVDDFEEKKNIIYQVSSLTHANIISKVACHFLVELIICLLKTNNIRTAYDTVCHEFAEYYTEDKIQSAFANIFSGKILSMPASSIKSSGYVIDTLEAVLWCVLNTTTYKDAVLTAVNLGDDTDTVGAITGGIAGIIYGLDAILEEWISKLVNKMIVLNAASDLYKKCNKDNIIDNLDFSV